MNSLPAGGTAALGGRLAGRTTSCHSTSRTRHLHDYLRRAGGVAGGLRSVPQRRSAAAPGLRLSAHSEATSTGHPVSATALRSIGATPGQAIDGDVSSCLGLSNTRPQVFGRRCNVPVQGRVSNEPKQLRTLVSGGRTHGMGHLADVRYGCRRWAERLLYGEQLTPACDRADSLLQQLLPCRVDSDLDPSPQSRPSPGLPGATIKPLETSSALVVGMADSSPGAVAGWGAHDERRAISSTPTIRPAAVNPSAMVACECGRL